MRMALTVIYLRVKPQFQNLQTLTVWTVEEQGAVHGPSLSEGPVLVLTWLESWKGWLPVQGL